MKRSLGSVKWARDKISSFIDMQSKHIKRCPDLEKVNKIRREAYGRVSSVMKQIRNELEYLEAARKTMKSFPSIKQMFTVCVFGFPNIGKTTLLSKITKSKPEIKDYAFTTKNLNVGYITTPRGKVQVIDTPGTLDRFDKMNSIEKQAYLALKHCADVVVYLIDLTESFPLADQEKLLKKVEKMGKKVLVYLSKADLLDEKKTEEGLRKHKDAFIDAEKLKKELISLSAKNNT